MKNIIRLLLLINALVLSLPVLAVLPQNHYAPVNGMTTLWLDGDLEPAVRALNATAMLFESGVAWGAAILALLVAIMLFGIHLIGSEGDFKPLQRLIWLLLFLMAMSPKTSMTVANYYDENGMSNAGAVKFRQVDNIPALLAYTVGFFSYLSNGGSVAYETSTQVIEPYTFGTTGKTGVVAGGISLYGSQGMMSPLKTLVALRRSFANSANVLVAGNLGRAAQQCNWSSRQNELSTEGYLNVLTKPPQSGITQINVLDPATGKKILTSMNCADAGKIIAAQSLIAATPKPGVGISQLAETVATANSNSFRGTTITPGGYAKAIQNELDQVPTVLAMAAGGAAKGTDNPYSILAFAYQRAQATGGSFNPNEMAQFFSAGVAVDSASIQTALMMNRIAARCLKDADCEKSELILGEALSTAAVDAAGEASSYLMNFSSFLTIMWSLFIYLTPTMMIIIIIRGVINFKILFAYITFLAWLAIMKPINTMIGNYMQGRVMDSLFSMVLEKVQTGNVAALLSPAFTDKIFNTMQKDILSASSMMSNTGFALFVLSGGIYAAVAMANRMNLVGQGSIKEKLEAPRLDESPVIDSSRMIDNSFAGSPLQSSQQLMSRAESAFSGRVDLSTADSVVHAAESNLSSALSKMESKTLSNMLTNVDSNGVATESGLIMTIGNDGRVGFDYVNKGDSVMRDGVDSAIGSRISGGFEAFKTGLSVDGSVRATQDNSLSYTDSNGVTRTLSASTALSDIQRLTTSAGTVDSNQISEAIQQTKQHLLSEQESLKTAASSTLSNGTSASIDLPTFARIGIAENKGNNPMDIFHGAAVAAGRYDKGVSEAIMNAVDKPGNTTHNVFSELYKQIDTGTTTEKLAGYAALQSVFGSASQAGVAGAEPYAAQLESRINALEYSNRHFDNVSNGLERPLSAANTDSLGNQSNPIDRSRLDNARQRLDVSATRVDETGKSIRDYQKIREYNLGAMREAAIEVNKIDKELRELENPGTPIGEKISKLGDTITSALSNPGAAGGMIMAQQQREAEQEAQNQEKQLHMDERKAELLARREQLVEKLQNFDPSNVNSTFDNKPIKEILGFDPAERRNTERIDAGMPSRPEGSSGTKSSLSTSRVGLDHLERNRAFGGEAVNGVKTHPGTLAAAHAMERLFDGSSKHDVRFSAFNDAFHVSSRPNSLHTKGLALDLVLDKEGKSTIGMHTSYQGWQETVSGIKDFMKENGFSHGNRKSGADYMVIYEPGGGSSTGNHIHFQFNNPEAAKRFEDLAQAGRISGLPTAAENPPSAGSDTVAGRNFASEIKNLMLKAEGNYNSVNFGKKAGNGSGTRNLGNMTLNQIIGAMSRNEFDAVGKYQIIPSTFKDGIKALGLSGNEKFTPQIQERFFNDYLIKKAGGGAALEYIQGKHNDINKALTAMAKEWASFPVPHDMKGHVQHVKAGQSYYHGYNGNKANVSLNDARSALFASRKSFMVP